MRPLIWTQCRGRISGYQPRLEVLEDRVQPAVTFAGQQAVASQALFVTEAVGDFNGDGRPDLALGTNTNSTAVAVLLNTTPAGGGTPSFAAPAYFATGTEPYAVAVGDFNGDGRPDLAVANFNDNTVSVLLNTTPAGSATPTFATQRTFAVGNGPFAITAADFNGDGRPDLAVANTTSNTVSVLLNTTPNGATTVAFAAQQTFAVGNSPSAVTAADFNGDGRPDLAVANVTGNTYTVSVLLNTTPSGAGTVAFAAQQTFAVGSVPRAVAVGDFNGDGRPDLAVANGGGATVSVLLNTTALGAGTPSFASQQTFAVGGDPYSVAVADLDGDGRPDLAVANESSATVSVLVNTTTAGAAAPAFASQQTFAVGQNPPALAAADVNGDGRPDLAVANFGSATVSVLLNTTTPFPSAVPVVVGQFGGQGVWEYNRTQGSWAQLTAANASLLAADPQGDVVGEFPGYGLWEFKPTGGWKQLNGVDATALVMGPAGNVVAEFPGYGVGEYLPAAGWGSLTGANASLLAVNANGDVVGEFPGYGVWEFRRSGGWKQLNGIDATLLALGDQGEVVANFRGYGVAEYTPAGGWQLLNGVEARALTLAANGTVTAQFPGYGVGQYLPAGGWRSLTGANAALLAADALGALFGAFAGYGVWEFDLTRGWFQVTAADAAALAVA